MRGLILAAGRGSRMGFATKGTPKCLLAVQGVSLLHWQISALQHAGVSSIAIVTGYLASQLDHFGSARIHNPDWPTTNMVASMIAADAWLSDETCIISYSDIVYERSAIALLAESTADIAITYDPNWLALWSRRFVDPLSDAESFSFSGDNHLTDIGRRSSSFAEINGQFMGLLRLTPRGWLHIREITSSLTPASLARLDVTALLSLVIQANSIPVVCLKYTDSWMEIDSLADLKIANVIMAGVTK